MKPVHWHHQKEERWCFFVRRERKQKIRVLRCKDPEQFENEFNQLTDELAHLNPETKIEAKDDYFVAILQFVVEKLIPETAEEELETQGLSFSCQDCPRFEPERNNDGSIRQTAKKGTCFLKDRTWRDSHACEWFCKEYLRGSIQPVEELK